MPKVLRADYDAVGDNDVLINPKLGRVQHKAEALLDFAKSWVTPFDGQHTKVPFKPPASGTTPVSTYFRGKMLTGTQNVCCAAWYPDFSSDATPILTSTAAYTGTSIVPTLGAAEFAQNSFVGSPFTASQFTEAATSASGTQRVMARPCRAAMRCRNVTPAQTRGGTGFMGNMTGGMSSCAYLDDSAYPQLKTQGSCIDLDVNGDWNEWTIAFDGENWVWDWPFRYPKFSGAISGNQTAVGGNPCVSTSQCHPCFIFISAPAGSAQTWELEIVFDYEYMMPGSQTTSAAPQTQNTNLPTAVPPHNEGTLELARSLMLARMTHNTGAVTAVSHRSTLNKITHFIKGVGHDIGNVKGYIEKGLNIGRGIRDIFSE